MLTRKIYIKQLIYKRGMGIDELGNEINRTIQTSRGKIIADSADPILIDHLRGKHRLNVHKADKGKDSISYGISAINEFELIVTKESKDVAIELSNYRYKEDADGNPLDEAIKEYDHSLDAMSYAVTSVISKKNNKFVLL